jgi:NADH-quinone oxidoreductase subunit N
MMIPFAAPSLLPALPEISLAIFCLLLLLLGVVGERENYKMIARLSVASLLTSGVIVYMLGAGSHAPGASAHVTFGGMFLSDTFAMFMKLLVIGGSAVSILMAGGSVAEARIKRFEYPVLILFSTLGMMLMVSANDLMALYVGIELQSLPLYILASIQRDSTRSTEAGLKYFVLGALSSGLLLYGMSLVYGYAGSTSYDFLDPIINVGNIGPGVMFGMVLMLCGLAFKVSAVPFHMWAPDVYEGAPAPVTAFFAIAPKIAAVGAIARLLLGPLGHLSFGWGQILAVVAAASMLLGAVAAIRQDNIKRLLAYSAIGNMGYILVGLAAGSQSGLMGVLVYSAVYMAASIGAFAVVLMMRQGGRQAERVADLAGLARAQPMTALAMAVMMFSMAGIPPLGGFFGKLIVFQAAVGNGLYVLAITGVLASVIAAYYYLRIVKVMYFDDAPEMPLDRSSDTALRFILAASAIVLVLFIVLPAPLMAAAKAAAVTLLPG